MWLVFVEQAEMLVKPTKKFKFLPFQGFQLGTLPIIVANSNKRYLWPKK